MQKKFKRKIRSLDDIFVFISEFVHEKHIDESNSYYLNLAIEELFTNMVKYNPHDPELISIDLESDSESLKIEITDNCLTPFDIGKAPAYDTKQSLEERPIGGVGIHLIKKIFDKINYEHQGNKSKITLVKFLGEVNV